MSDIFVNCINMDTCVKEQVVHNSDDSYTIFINSRLAYIDQLHSYKHAISHINNGDFYGNDVNAIEQKAHAE